MLSTPNLSHLNAGTYYSVYEPAEDTFALMDSLEQDYGLLRNLHPNLSLEIGSGSGCVSVFLSDVLGHSDALYLCTDVNKDAAFCTVQTAKQNKTALDAIVSDLLQPFTSRLQNKVDVLLFNPPYVPTNDTEFKEATKSRGITASWAGGLRGMAVTSRLLEQAAKSLLSPTGLFYLVAIKDNDVETISRMMAEKFDLCCKIVLERRAGREHLFVLRFHRRTNVIDSLLLL